MRLPSEDQSLQERLKRSVVVTLSNGGAFEGVLYEYDAKSLVLRNAVLMAEPPAPSAPVDGELLILWEHVLYVQFS